MREEEMDIRTAIGRAIDEEMARDKRVFLLGEEVGEYNGAYKVTRGLLDKYGPRRVLDTPISEGGFSGLAIGAAMTGLRPIVEFMSWNFSFVACDQILSNAAKMHYMSNGRFSLPIVFRGPNGAAAQVSCQHSHCVEALYAHFPGLYVIAPSTPLDALGLMKSAIRNDNPVLVLESELTYSHTGKVPIESELLIPLGKARLVRQGSDLTLICWSRMVSLCEQVATLVQSEGISVEVIDLRSIVPLDLATLLASLQKTHHCLIVEEGHSFCGVAAELACQLSQSGFDFLDAPISRVSQRETPMPYSRILEQETLPNEERIIRALFETLSLQLPASLREKFNSSVA